MTVFAQGNAWEEMQDVSVDRGCSGQDLGTVLGCTRESTPILMKEDATMTSFLVSAASRSVAGRSAILLTIGFNKEVPANNDRLVPDAIAAVNACELKGGEVVLLSGPASLPVAMAIGHALAHLFGAVAGFDPKMNSYIVSIAHGPAFKPGDVIAAADVQG